MTNLISPGNFKFLQILITEEANIPKSNKDFSQGMSKEVLLLAPELPKKMKLEIFFYSLKVTVW